MHLARHIGFLADGQWEKRAMDQAYGVLRVIGPEDAEHAQPPPDETLVFPISQPQTSLGRGLHNAIVLFDVTVSREHALLNYNDGQWSITNLSRTSPLTIADLEIPVAATARIRPGQEFQIGSVKLQLVAPDMPLSVLKLARSDASSAGSTMLRYGTNTLIALRQQARGWGRLGLVALILLFCLGLLLVLIGISTLITQGANEGSTGLLAKLTIPLIPAIGIVLLITLVDRYEQRPWYLLLSAFLWGALIAIPPAFFIERFFSNIIQALPAGAWGRVFQSFLLGLNAGLTEEAVKGIGLILLVVWVRNKFATVSDGIIYGAIIGAGFGMIENVAYFALAQSRRDLVILIIGRVILGWLGHSTFTACLGATIGFVRERHPHRAWRYILLGFLVAVGLHTYFDFIAVLASDVGLGAPASAFLALLAVVADYLPLFVAQSVLYVILMRSLAREAAILREYLVGEVCQGVVMPEEYLLLQEAAPRQRLQRFLLLAHGFKFFVRMRQLQQALVGLGFSRYQEAMIARGYQLPTSLMAPENYRRRIRHLRREIARSEEQFAVANQRKTHPTLTPLSDHGNR